MVKPIAVFHHSWFQNFEHGVGIIQEQMLSLEQSGLLENASEVHMGVSGGTEILCAVSMFAPKGANLFRNGDDTCGELPTLCAMQEWLKTHQDWYVAYFHTKGAQYPKSTTWAAWRRCQDDVVIWGWKNCVGELDQGFDCVGAHLIDPKKYGAQVGNYPYFGGNAWFAKARHLLTLPALSPYGPSRYEAEVWIGKTRRKINFRDRKPHWPGAACLRQCT